VLDLSGFAIELKILRHNASQTMLVKADDAIDIFAAERADDAPAMGDPPHDRGAATFLMPAA
jgi:hypothetical protein